MDEYQTAQEKLSNRVLSKIGSNLLLFQQIERLLKSLLRTSHVQGSACDLMAYQEQRIGKIQKNMMGLLARQYIDEILSENDETIQEPENLSGVWLSFSFKTVGDQEFNQLQSQNLKMVVEERNELVHHFLPRWQPDSLDYMTDTCAYLDKQREKVLPVWKHLVSVVKSKQLLANLMASDEFARRSELQWLRESPLITLLRAIAVHIGRSDGWACLAHAGKLAHMQLADDIAHMKETYGYNTLRKLLIASERFEILDEALPNGGYRTFYRVLDANSQLTSN